MILGSLLLFSIKKKAGTYEQPRLGHLFIYRELARGCRLAVGSTGKETDKAFERHPGLFAILFLHLASTLPKQQLLGI